MKTISSALETHLSGESTNLATCWKMILKNGGVMGFTDHDKPIVFESITYQAAAGFNPSAVATTDNLAIDNLEIEGVIDSDNIRESDILAGKFDFAEVEIFIVNYEDLSQGKMHLKRGWLGEVSFDKNQFTAEVRGLSQRLIKTIGAIYSPSCRANLGDGRCKVNMADFTVTGTVTATSSSALFYDSSRGEDDGYFNFGKITFTSGLNDGLSMEVKEFVNDQIVLVMPMPYEIQAGDGYSMEAGCDKTFDTCISRFANAINFHGEPHMPGMDRILETSGTRTNWDE